MILVVHSFWLILLILTKTITKIKYSHQHSLFHQFILLISLFINFHLILLDFNNLLILFETLLMLLKPLLFIN